MIRDGYAVANQPMPNDGMDQRVANAQDNCGDRGDKRIDDDDGGRDQSDVDSAGTERESAVNDAADRTVDVVNDARSERRTVAVCVEAHAPVQVLVEQQRMQARADVLGESPDREESEEVGEIRDQQHADESRSEKHEKGVRGLDRERLFQPVERCVAVDDRRIREDGEERCDACDAAERQARGDDRDEQHEGAFASLRRIEQVPNLARQVPHRPCGFGHDATALVEAETRAMSRPYAA